jgi:hypothetical protein
VAKDYPTDVNFILCEDIREEAHGKFSLLGVFGGQSVLVPESVLGQALPCIAVFSSFADGAGTFRAVNELLDPSGKIIASNRDENLEVKKDPDKNMLLLMKWVPFPISSFGTYTVQVFLDNTNYEFEFGINKIK